MPTHKKNKAKVCCQSPRLATLMHAEAKAKPMVARYEGRQPANKRHEAKTNIVANPHKMPDKSLVAFKRSCDVSIPKNLSYSQTKGEARIGTVGPKVETR